MRDIKFRGKTRENQWVYGFPVIGEEEDECFFHHPSYSPKYVYPKTICQYIGEKDKYGKEIYEDDIVIGAGWEEDEIFIVKYGMADYYLEAPEGADYEYYNGDFPHGDRVQNWSNSVVIGNIYDNPELLMGDDFLKDSTLFEETGSVYKVINHAFNNIKEQGYYKSIFTDEYEKLEDEDKNIVIDVIQGDYGLDIKELIDICIKESINKQ